VLLPECRVIKHGQILLDRTARLIRRQAFLTRMEALAIGFRADEARIHGKAVAADHALGNAALHGRLE
jgi:hypothetical protein